MIAAKHNLIIDQGADWSITLTYKDGSGVAIPLTGYTSSMQLRKHYDDASAVLSLTSSSGMTITASTGTIVIRATSAQTGAIVAGDYVYDVEISTSGGVVTRLIYGSVKVRPQVTR
jgi:hypothetical protein